MPEGFVAPHGPMISERYLVWKASTAALVCASYTPFTVTLNPSVFLRKDWSFATSEVLFETPSCNKPVMSGQEPPGTKAVRAGAVPTPPTYEPPELYDVMVPPPPEPVEPPGLEVGVGVGVGVGE